ncbi:MAG: amino acid adenylation domain-containing protein, partial [Bacteroidota bacterium]
MLPESQRKLALASPQYASAKVFWERELAIAAETPEFQSAPSPLVRNSEWDTCVAALPTALAERFVAITGGQPAAAFALFSTLSIITLQKTTQTCSLRIGMLVDDPTLSYAPQNNLLPYHEEVKGEDTLKSLLLRISKQIRNVYSHRDFPVDVLAAQQGNSLAYSVALASEALHPIQLLRSSSAPLCLYLTEQHGVPALGVQYDQANHHPRAIENLMLRWETMAQKVFFAPDQPLHEVHTLTQQESASLLEEINQTQQPTRFDTALTLWEEAQAQHAHRIAVADASGTYTYQQLDQKAVQVAGALQAAGVQAGDAVGLMFTPGFAMASALIGCFKCGAAFVPLDPSTPQKRLEAILEDLGQPVVLAEAQFQERLNPTTKRVIWEQIQGESPFTPVLVQPEQPVYIIFTSGSTGTPKGVMLPHRALANYAQWMMQRAQLSHEDASMLTSSYAFDLGYTTIFPTLFAGGTLHLFPRENYLDPTWLTRYATEAKVTYLKVTPSFLRLLVFDDQFQAGAMPQLRLVVCGGEAIDVEAIQRVFAVLGDQVQVMNHYGPTESTVGVIHQMITQETLGDFVQQPVIGRPVGNCQAWVLNEDLSPTAPGLPGMLYVSGDSLFTEYLNDPENTQAKRISNPLRPGEAMYCTGDLVRWTVHHTLEFIGRQDNQIK